ncbi:MAG TPA: alcohol dehydrogenase catalytic domain-containing protein [Ktedonobacteraceae bacterium]|nr:alcohol dehydrogenase catalytic domain-containing protein [Ktedonobacteraceae bacterium]
MWTSTMELSPRRVLLTRLLGQFWRGAYFSSFAPLQVQNLPRPTLPARDWIRVRNRLAGICGSDLHFIAADGDFRIAPAALPAHKRSYPGHEVVGEVIEVGEDVQRVKVGDRVTLQYGQNCVSQGIQPLCRSCAAGQYSLCEQGTFSGQEQIGGGWSEEMLLHESQVFRVPDELSNEQAVLIEPTAVALHAVLRRLPQPGDNVLIVGSGTIGLLTLQIVRALAPQATVSMMARYPFQVEQATRMGAEHIIYPQDTYKEVEQATGAKLYRGMMGNTMLLGGYDVIFDTIGTRHTLHDALRWTRAGGAVVIIGVSLHMMRLDLTPVWYQEVSLIGSMSHGIEQWPLGSQERYSTFAIAAELMAQGLIHPDKLITHHFALTDFPEALMTAAAKTRTRAIKVVFDYDKMPASVVPNVRSSARLRRPARSTTTTTGEAQVTEEAQEQPYQQIQPPATVEPAQAEHEWDHLDMPSGGTWAQQVNPFPSTPPLERDSSEPVLSTDYEPEPTIPQHLLALTKPVEEPADDDELLPMDYAQSFSISEAFPLSSTPTEAMAEPLTTTYEQPFAVTEEPTLSIPREPQPILLPNLASTDDKVGQADELQVEPTVSNQLTRQSRQRQRSAPRKTPDQPGATTEPTETL